MAPLARFPRPLALALAAMLVLVGCSDLPTKPSDMESLASEATVTSGSSSEILGFDSEESGTAALTTTRRIIGLLGGTLRAGDFTVVIPPGAISGTAMVTVSQPNPARPVVELGIAPASANRFLLPVLLVANAKAMDRSLLSVAYISYFNPTTGQWERVANSSVNLLNLTVTAPLWHFSRYRVDSGGKAGW